MDLDSDYKEPDPREVEKYLRIRPGALDHIPHYAIQGAIVAIENVRYMEQQEIFRPSLYYVVLCDLCGSTKGSALLGKALNIRRIESFILTCIEALSNISPNNYFLPIREIGDAVLIVFSSFEDAYNWWFIMHEWLAVSNFQWQQELSAAEFTNFIMEAKTIIHVGEVAYSDKKIPVSQAVNQVFKVEKLFKAGELGLTSAALSAAAPIVRVLNLRLGKEEALNYPVIRI